MYKAHPMFVLPLQIYVKKIKNFAMKFSSKDGVSSDIISVSSVIRSIPLKIIKSQWMNCLLFFL